MTPGQPHSALHRWIVDGIEEDIARIVEDGARTFHVPCSLLPDGVREGQVLTVVRTGDEGAGVRLEITIDAAATEAARSAAQADATRTIALIGRRDEGGDVIL